jgi:hypothetical protein
MKYRNYAYSDQLSKGGLYQDANDELLMLFDGITQAIPE